MPALQLAVLPEILAVCRLPAAAPIPAWATQGNFWSVTGTADELSLVCAQAQVPTGVQREDNWRGLRVVGTLDFALTGILAALVAPLAAAKISVFAIATFDTDYLLVQADALEQTVAVLRQAGHDVAE